MNVYNNPEKYGLEIIFSIDYSDGCYEYDYRVIWREIETGKLYTAHDSGCSCTSPFEDIDSILELEDYSYNFVREEALAKTRKENYHGDDVCTFINQIPR